MAGLIIAGSALQAAGQIQEGRAAEKEGNAAYRMSLYNKEVQEREARAIETKTRFDSLRQAKMARQAIGKLRTRLAASGAELGTGATAALEDEQFAEFELENMLIGYEGGRAAEKARRQGDVDVYYGKLAKQRGKLARRASYIKAASSLLTGFGAAGAFEGAGFSGRPEGFSSRM